MSSYAKYAGVIEILLFEKDMNIDWLANKIEINSKCLQNLGVYNLGTDKFFNSVTEVTIDYLDAEAKPEIDENIDLINEHFKNLSCIYLKNLRYLSISEIVTIYTENKLHKSLSTKYDLNYSSDVIIPSYSSA